MTTTPELDRATAYIASIGVEPLQAGTAATTLRDLSLAVGWHDLRALKLEGTQWSVLVGHKRKQDPLRAVLPLPLHTTALIPSELHAIFGALLKIEFTSLPPVVPEFAPSVDAVREEYARRTRGDLAEIDEEKEDEDEDEDKSEKKGEEAEVKEDKGGEFDPDTLYVAIGCADSTVVYYKLSRGIRKPHDVPDE